MPPSERSVHEVFHQQPSYHDHTGVKSGLLLAQTDPLRDFDDDSDLSSPRPVTRPRQLEAAYELIPVTDDESEHNLQNETDMGYDDDGTYNTGLGYDDHRSDTTQHAQEAHAEHVFNPQTPNPKKKRKSKEFDPEISVRESFEPESEHGTEHGTDNVEQPKKKRKRLDTTANLKDSAVQVPQSLRRSPRIPYAPLEWWRNEKVEYGGRDPNGEKILVPRIRAIIRIPKIPIVPRKRSRRQRAADDKPKERKKKIVFLPKNPEEGWDNDTQATATVKELITERDVSRRIAFTARMYKPQFIGDNSSWSFEKIFQDSEFIAAGQMVIERNARKPVRSSNDNTFIFLVIEGAVNVNIHETSLIVTSGGSFMVPRGRSISAYSSWARD